MRSSAPSSRAIAVMLAAPPAIIEKAPVTGLIPRWRRSRRPATTLSASVAAATRTTGSQSPATSRRVSGSTSAPSATPTTARAAVLAGSGTVTGDANARARTSPATSPPNSAGEGSPSSSRTTETARPTATTTAPSSTCRHRCAPTGPLRSAVVVTLPRRPPGRAALRR